MDEDRESYDSNDEMIPAGRASKSFRAAASRLDRLHAVTLVLVCGASLSVIISCILYLSLLSAPPASSISCNCGTKIPGHVNPEKDGFSFPLDEMPLASELNGLVPSFKQEIVTFWNDSKYVPVQQILDREPLSNVVTYITEAWGKLMPPHQAFISVPHPEQYVLPLQLEDAHGDKTDLYGISVFHQLHCLFLLLRSWTAYHYGGDQFNEPEHLLHCFDFIRIQLMCVGDTALEGADAVSILKGKKTGTIGLGSRHICRDWDALFDWTVEHESKAAVSHFHEHEG